MIPEIGHFALLLCLPLALVMAIVPLIGVATKNAVWMRFASSLAIMQWGLLLFSFLALSYSFFIDDFSVKLVTLHSNTALPWYFKLSAVWGNHEGSLLLWVFILASWTLAVALASGSIPLVMKTRVLSVLAMVSLGFLAFIIFTSNPFDRSLIMTPSEGNDLNPLLQDIGLIIHPPMLYIGYVGFSVAFAFAIAALLEGRFDAEWARWTRPWTNIAWAFLTVGIALGSWWAYYELGWGGWWFWDPVENASLMPWLAGAALVHSLSATEKRGVFKSWTILLALLAFSLSLLGTFLVRSGILVSVHAFASDPERGLFILAFLFIVVGGSLLLYALRAPIMKGGTVFALISRENFLLINNVLFSIALTVVLLGTLFPLISTALDLGSYSVGAPYFNAMFVPLGLLTLFIMCFAPFIAWNKFTLLKEQSRQWMICLLLAIFLAMLLVRILSHQYVADFNFLAFFIASLCLWLVVNTLGHFFFRLKHAGLSFHSFSQLSLSYYGMVIAHIGMAVMILGIGITSIYESQKDVRMAINDNVSINAYRYQLTEISSVTASNYDATRASVDVYYDSEGEPSRLITTLYPEKRFYRASRNIMTEAGIDASLSRDLYVALGEQLESGVWAVRVHVKPLVRCIWLGAILIALGAILAIFDKRYKRSSAARSESVLGSPSNY
ncbi:MAG: heme lyase NrfEFG subunit NrfE [Cellvibrionales bacterium]|nr:heme lyase NrfEFG subunit NrfE [Cellvibrionales bacterium]